MRKKFRSSKGMTLTELLVALAIVALIGMSLAMGVNNAAKIYRNATRLYEAETLCGTILTYLEDEFRFSRNIRQESGVVFFDSQAFGNDVKVVVAGEETEDTEDDGKIKLVGTGAGESYDLLGARAYTSGLMVIKDECEISYSDGLVTIKIAVGPDKDNVYASHTVTVAPVND